MRSLVDVYQNPIYQPFLHQDGQERARVSSVLEKLVDRHGGVLPIIESGERVEVSVWNPKRRERKPALLVRWDATSMSPERYATLERIFDESVLFEDTINTRELYRRKRRAPATYVLPNASTTRKARGYPISRERQHILTPYEITNEDPLLWVTRHFRTLAEARQRMRGRGSKYWFYQDGRFQVELRAGSITELAFLDSSLRISHALYDGDKQLDRQAALLYAQKLLARKGSESPEPLIGLDDLLEEVKYRQFFATAYPEQARALGVRDESVLLVGVPGVGKSAIAANLLHDPGLEDVPMLPVSIRDLLDASVASDTQLGSFFSGLDTLASRYGIRPLLWCDDLEAAFLDDSDGVSKTHAMTQTTMLNGMQGALRRNTVRISGSTNHPHKIDRRFLEFGRISYLMHVPIPRDPAVLHQVLQARVIERGQQLHPGVNLEEIAASSVGFTPRLLDNLVNEAGAIAARRLIGTFGTEATMSAEDLVVTPEDYAAASAATRARADLDGLRRWDEQLATFVNRSRSSPIGFTQHR